ncbi:hypothetical protein TREMEDRAFT_61412 [Tremella mesenterica DSM 1558]|uniref:uncharacterized protein n=1 Tax=Tremella mesenterica (strain ATCC 24925 / CBS 8224 / DSM 1558 / NBRC 9311 / NRRL Y-6157 / RJB 2259-6 / UBC 559-6) TaxID=578456 RepID=UPI0003F4914B|nr:uncharacterized protein TREMEDRAFT_61412 [Tremella mesenterica DSM 1558]EIW70899.1 hypothetical protein TREMEDRAFT_61412 [Tremella mesenterica DSM 1558]
MSQTIDFYLSAALKSPSPTALSTHSSPLTPLSSITTSSSSATSSFIDPALLCPAPLDFDALLPASPFPTPFLTPPSEPDGWYGNLSSTFSQNHGYSWSWLSMSPKAPLHSGNFPYGSNTNAEPVTAAGVSSERSTVNETSQEPHQAWVSKHQNASMPSTPTDPSQAHGPGVQTLPQGGQSAGNMLPPLRLPDARSGNNNGGTPTNGYPGYPYPTPYGYPYHPGQQMYYHPPPQAGDGYSQGYSPISAFGVPHHAHQHGTIQPSAFSSWSDRERDGDDRPSLDRRASSTSTGVGMQDRYGEKPLASPAMSQRSDEQAVDVMYTSDAEVKQTLEVRRRCHNCHSTTPPSWRKSVLYPGKILCNKCGIFERTHRKSRPQQTDDQKLRKSTGYGQVEMLRRNPLPHLQMTREDPVSPGSAYSTVPSQATPVSATSGSYTSPLTSSALPRRGSSSTAQALGTPFTSGELRSVSYHPYARSPPSPYHPHNRRAASYQYPPGPGYYIPSPAQGPMTPHDPREMVHTVQVGHSQNVQGVHHVQETQGHNGQSSNGGQVEGEIKSPPNTAGVIQAHDSNWPQHGTRRHSDAHVHSLSQ